MVEKGLLLSYLARLAFSIGAEPMAAALQPDVARTPHVNPGRYLGAPGAALALDLVHNLIQPARHDRPLGAGAQLIDSGQD